MPTNEYWFRFLKVVEDKVADNFLRHDVHIVHCAYNISVDGVITLDVVIVATCASSTLMRLMLLLLLVLTSDTGGYLG